MKLKIIIFIIPFLLVIKSQKTYAQITTPICDLAQPICSDTSNVFPNSINTNIPVGPDYGCLDDYLTIPILSGMSNPQWYYFKISSNGVIELQLSQYDSLGNGIDLDFAMWGPYSSLQDGCNAVMSGTEYPIQCSINSNYVETIGLGTLGGGNAWGTFFPFLGFTDGTSTPPSAITGEYYIIIVSNPDNQPGTISLLQTNGDGALDCSIITDCDISVNASAGACDPISNEFNVTGTITFSDAPDTGNLVVEDCNGNSVTFSAPFTSPINYTISGISSDGANCDISAYFTDDLGCFAVSDSYQNPASCICIPPNININDITACSSADLNNALGNGSDPATLTFYNSQNDANSASNPINNIVMVAGVYWIRAESPNDPTCFNIYQVTVTFQNISYVATISNTNCGINDGAIQLTANGGTQPYIYSVDNGITTQNNGDFNGLGAGSYQIYIEDSNGCSVNGTEVVGNTDGPNIDNIILTAISCNGECDGNIEIIVSEGATPYNYTWTNNGTIIGNNSNTLNDLCAGHYTILISDDNNCSITINQELTEPQLLDASFSGLSSDYCANDTIVELIPVQPGGIFEGPGVSGNTFSPIEAGLGSHTITYTINNGENCSESEIFNVQISGPTASFTADPMITDTANTLIQFTNESIEASSYIWHFGDSLNTSNEVNPYYEYPSSPDVYIVTLLAEDDKGCIDTAVLTIEIIDVETPEAIYKLPNIFTPNGDGQNDNFHLINPENISKLEITVVNRWGAVVFQSSDINFTWNGKINNNGAECVDGTYFYYIKITDLKAEEIREHGFIHLNR